MDIDKNEKELRERLEAAEKIINFIAYKSNVYRHAKIRGMCEEYLQTYQQITDLQDD